ncbi:6-phosphogluconate dehydrogenase (decarboxylating) [Streptomyces sp. HB372]|nr:6-phosphogluconate dehydrogenase (decarboxylating) [Streptomyces sp. HB372]
MELGLVGLGKMGGNMRERIRRAGHTVIGYDRNPDVADVHSLEELVGKLKGPRVIWVMVPAGAATQSTIDELAELLSPGDIVVDGGNSRWTDDEKHAVELGIKDIGFVDCGVSGGVWGPGERLRPDVRRHRGERGEGPADLRRAEARG